jgi:hypothetical protein
MSQANPSRDTTFKSFALAFRPHWLAAMSGGFSVPFVALAAYLDSGYAKVIFAALAFCSAWFAAYTVWKFERAAAWVLRARVTALEERLRPKIKIISVSDEYDPVNIMQKFQLAIKNDSGVNSIIASQSWSISI